jgi:hypothetical protein
MDNRDFNRFVNSLPTVTRVVGHTANGTALTVQVHSLFADVEEVQ